MDRPSRAETFMETAHVFAKRSTCERGHVGAVIVRDNRIIATGYNGAPPGLPHCVEVGCEELTLYEDRDSRNDAGEVVYEEVNLGCQRTIHAEANALAWAARAGVSTFGAVIFCTHSPCLKCVQLMASAGIKEMVYEKEYRATPWDLLADLEIAIVGIGR